ncbi:MAG: hypothetical protein QXI16_03390 [Sulfolobaceae archaeon]
MKNYVEVYEDKKLIGRSENLVVTTGRNFLMNLLTSSVYNNWSLNYFAVGNGGGDPSNPLIPIAPQSSDTTLTSPLILGSGYAGGGYYKPITSITPVTQTSCLVTLTVAQSDLSSYGYVLYNEVGLFAASNTNPTTFILYARITIPIQKDPTRSQVLQWYLFF